MSAPTCPSCGVAYRVHLGLHGTCAQLVEARAALAASEDRLRAALNEIEQLRPALAVERDAAKAGQ